MSYSSLQDFYKTKLRNNGLLSASALSYHSVDTQALRFEQMLKIIPDKIRPYSLLDVGCGLADFSAFLKDRGYKNIKYLGLDVVPEMVVGARLKHPDVEVRLGDILQGNLPQADLVTASGALTIVYESQAKQLQHIKTGIRNMYEAAKICCAFNLLKDENLHKYEKDDRFYFANMKVIMDYCNSLCAHCTLLADYAEDDFSVILAKDSAAGSN